MISNVLKTLLDLFKPVVNPEKPKTPDQLKAKNKQTKKNRINNKIARESRRKKNEKKNNR